MIWGVINFQNMCNLKKKSLTCKSKQKSNITVHSESNMKQTQDVHSQNTSVNSAKHLINSEKDVGKSGISPGLGWTVCRVRIESVEPDGLRRQDAKWARQTARGVRSGTSWRRLTSWWGPGELDRGCRAGVSNTTEGGRRAGEWHPHKQDNGHKNQRCVHCGRCLKGQSGRCTQRRGPRACE